MHSRRLPVYILIDSSGSMKGEPIQAANAGLRSIVTSMRQNPQCLETVHLSVIQFDAEAKIVIPLTSVIEARPPEIEVPKSGPTHLGAALGLLKSSVEHEVVKSSSNNRGDYRPLLFIITDDQASDEYAFLQIAPVIRTLFGKIIACAAGPRADTNQLLEVADDVVQLEQMTSSSFNEFFEFVSEQITTSSTPISSTLVKSDATPAADEPPPEPEVQFTLTTRKAPLVWAW